MRQLFRWVRSAWSTRKPHRRHATYRPYMDGLEDRRLLAASFLQTNLVSDIPGLAAVTDPNLINPWGLIASSTSPFWVSDNNSGLSTLYNGQGQIVPLVVTIPTNPTGGPDDTAASPTGVIANGSGGFIVSANGVSGSPAFIFATEDGTISGWSPVVDGTHAILEVGTAANPTADPGAVYKGLAIDTDSFGRTLLYATNFHGGTVDVYGQNYRATTVPGGFHDANIPDGYAPFNIQNIGGLLYVTYAVQNDVKHDDVPGPGNGFVDVFNSDGQLMRRLVAHGQLDSPWGLAIAPAGFGSFGGDLLVGNFGDGHINAYDPTTGAFIGQLKTSKGQPFTVDGLWALRFGNDAGAGSSHTLFFTAGINGESDGLFGSLQTIPRLANDAAIVPNLGSTPEQVFSTRSVFSTGPTVPESGDQNPYGVAFVPQGINPGGVLRPGDLLVSNFNDVTNTQGTGSTIIRITPSGERSVFFQGEPGLGLTTALGVLKSGFVIVGNVPTTSDGTAQQGGLTILDSNGNIVTQLSDATLLNGPWDLAVNDLGDRAEVFVSNVLSGTVTRIDLSGLNSGTPTVDSETQIASGYAFGTDPTALVVGPTGLAFDAQRDILFVASTADNAIFAIPHAATTSHDHGMGRLVFQDDAHLHGPLGLALAPNGDLITANGDAVNPDPTQPNELVEFTPQGQFVGQFQLDTTQDSSGNIIPGAGFGLAVSSADGRLRIAAADDNTNTVNVFTFRQKTSSFSTHDQALEDVFAAIAQYTQVHHHLDGNDVFGGP